MAYEITKLVVADSLLFNRTGQVGRWAEGINVSFVANAKREAPDGKVRHPVKTKKNQGFPAGSLQASIIGDVDRVGPKQLVTTVSVNVPYAQVVLRGYPGIITASVARVPAGTAARSPGGKKPGGQYAPGLRGMLLPPNPGYHAGRVQAVRGQAANNFLGRAFDRTARKHSSLRGFSIIGS